jgi:arylsulfatase A-like enzyme
MFKAENIKLRPNVPKDQEEKARKDLAGYYAHIAALDDCVGDILKTIKETGIEDNTIFVFTSDHGDMLYSHGWQRKQKPWDESIKVPFLLRYPAVLGKKAKEIDVLFGAPDIMPTLLGLSGIKIPRTVEGEDFSRVFAGKKKSKKQAALISCPAPFGEWTRKKGGREYRGVRTRRYTYARTLKGPWLLYDNKKDPYQLNNLCNKPKYAKLQQRLESVLAKRLEETNDDFLSGWDYIKKWKYVVHENGTAPFTN